MRIDENGRYVIDNYDQRRPFASFLPGIAGPMGRPLWAFYVNRGQAICSFGVKDKESAILEYRPAVKAYQSVCVFGFRTFLKIRTTDDEEVYVEPFNRIAPGDQLQTQMRIGLNDLEILDVNSRLGFETRVSYFVMPSAPLAALVRKLVITNTSARELRGEIIDGLPAITPFGVPNGLLKGIGNTLMAWMRVENLERGIPLYRIGASIQDRPEVSSLDGGNFYSCIAATPTGTEQPVAIVDPDVVFGMNTALTFPERFLNTSVREIARAAQVTCGKIPCGFFATSLSLQEGQQVSLYALVGHVGDVTALDREVPDRMTADFIEAKHREAVALGETITQPAETCTSSRVFDLYGKQTFLDNVLRGGYPRVFPGPDGPHVYPIYGRRHGDLERDYNAFTLPPTYYSQGDGAYRDVNQNRRCDVFVEPRIEDATARTFLNLIQTDGYNPLALHGCTFTLDPNGRELTLRRTGADGSLNEILSKPFTPGELLRHIEEHGVKLRVGPEEFLDAVLCHSQQQVHAAFHEGYWTDHWSYNLDLIDNLLAVYPDQKEEFLFDRAKYTFYDGSAVVRPRSEKYVEVDGSPRQLGAVVLDAAKEAMIAGRREFPNLMRTQRGKGGIYRTHLFGKLLALCAVKFSTLDPFGMGVEMEADKPGWCDALNGLPALFGSCVSETYEIKRLVAFLQDVVAEYPQRKFTVAREVLDFAEKLAAALEEHGHGGDNFPYWDRVSSLREAYRAENRRGFSGEEVRIEARQLEPMLNAFQAKVEAGIARAKDFGHGLPPTYFYFEPVQWRRLTDAQGAIRTNDKGQPRVCVEAFRPVPLPWFLEAVVKEMKLSPSVAEAAALHERVKASALFDRKLGMYKLNAPLDDQPIHIGRSTVYTPGWLENESIFMHMHYKYLLALLTAGLYEDFWQEARRGLVPFFDPEVYGRSVLENSTFVVSSAHPDPTLHGKGFVARLSGATAEFISMWMLATVGPKPFFVSEGELAFQPSPALPGWLFREDGTLSFTFLGKVKVTYHNRARQDLMPGKDVRIRRIHLVTERGDTVEIEGAVVPPPRASRIRESTVTRMEVFFG